MGQWPVVCLAMIVIHMGFHTWPGLEKFDGFRLQPKGVSVAICNSHILSQAFRLTHAARLSSVECDPLCQAYFILSRSFIFIYPETAPFNTLLWLDTILCFVCARGHTTQHLVLQAGSTKKFTVKLHSCIGYR